MSNEVEHDGLDDDDFQYLSPSERAALAVDGADADDAPGDNADVADGDSAGASAVADEAKTAGVDANLNDDAQQDAQAQTPPSSQDAPGADEQADDAGATDAAGKREASADHTGDEGDEGDEGADKGGQALPQTGAPDAALPDFAGLLVENSRARADLRRRFAAGEFDATQFEAHLDSLAEDREQIMAARIHAQVSEQVQSQTAQNEWHKTIASFMRDVRGEVNYRKETTRHADLDLFVKALANSPENAQRPMRWFLEEAHKRVMALHGVTAPAPAAAKPAAQPVAAVAARRADPSQIVQTLAQVPGAAGDIDPVSVEFADIDKLDGLAFEQALAALPEAKRERYLAMQ